jgi:hypothetical protein
MNDYIIGFGLFVLAFILLLLGLLADKFYNKKRR